ncbi:glycosyltransferase [Microbacterium sp. SLBN-146]|uniref:glycosyltransferase family 2 protein n=1 Tax=Microbacterium sp. SLBN-146 TaxID=2768457 RepID=UPI00117341A7|nr:glycosyltransferase [Microbacterium sp. SLBN-146]TQJ30884.1 glycosyl transferase family 2 [Microbacterium sp. SLBN-146]
MTAAPDPPVALVTCLHFPGSRLAGAIARLEDTSPHVSEIVVVLDGVTDDERREILEWAPLLPKVRILQPRSPLGVANARNLALAAVTSEYVWFVDDDDEWVPDAARVVADSLADGYDVIAFRARYRDHPDSAGRVVDGVDESRGTTAREARRMLLDGTLQGFLWSKLFARRVLGTDPFPDLSSQSDVVGVARALARSHRLRLRPEELYTYVNRPGSITRTSALRLQNLARASDLVVEALADDADPAETDHFRAWFSCSGTVRTVARQRVPLREAMPALRDAQRSARLLARRGVRGDGARMRLELAALRLDPRVAVILGRFAYALLDARRAFRRRAS